MKAERKEKNKQRERQRENMKMTDLTDAQTPDLLFLKHGLRFSIDLRTLNILFATLFPLLSVVDSRGRVISL